MGHLTSQCLTNSVIMGRYLHNQLVGHVPGLEDSQLIASYNQIEPDIELAKTVSSTIAVDLQNIRPPCNLQIRQINLGTGVFANFMRPK